jgi:DNA-binding LacI/PurR family transcriptional regulator
MTILQPPRRAAPTLEAVAAEAGVSRSTVSRVVNGSNQVRADVVEIVQAAIERLNYVPNRAARSLANSQAMAIALVIPEDTSRFFGDPYFASVVQGLAKGLESSDYVLNLQLASQSKPSQKTIRYLTGGNVDGAFVVSHHSGDHFLADLGSSLPVVFGGRPLRAGNPPSYYVDVDNNAAAAMGTQYLIDQGRTRIATIAGPADMPAGIDRAAGWSSALAAAGLTDERIVHGDFSQASGAQGMREPGSYTHLRAHET